MLLRATNNGKGGSPNHRYSTKPAIIDAMVAQGWVSEGTVMCVAVSQEETSSYGQSDDPRKIASLGIRQTIAASSLRVWVAFLSRLPWPALVFLSRERGVDVWTPIGPKNLPLETVVTDPSSSARVYATLFTGDLTEAAIRARPGRDHAAAAGHARLQPSCFAACRPGRRGNLSDDL